MNTVCISRFVLSKRHGSFGRHKDPHLANMYFFSYADPLARRGESI